MKNTRLSRRHLIGHPLWVARGLFELLRARLAVRNIKASDIVALNLKNSQLTPNTRIDAERIVDRVALIIPLLSRMVPWHSNCVAQAISAQRWLAGYGLHSKIHIGFDNMGEKTFEAHAWLIHEKRVVTGGEVEHYHLLLGDPPSDRDRCSAEPDELKPS